MRPTRIHADHPFRDSGDPCRVFDRVAGHRHGRSQIAKPGITAAPVRATISANVDGPGFAAMKSTTEGRTC
jgi:hypothetical protein